MNMFIQRPFWYILLFAVQDYRICAAYDPEASITGLYTGPYFDPLTNRNLTAHLGDQAVLPCTVRQLGDKSVSWIRMRDSDIIAVDRYTFVSDERFTAYYLKSLETWNLAIKYVQERDEGWFECQVSTEPKMSQLFNLRVVVPKVKMDPPGDRFVKSGSQVRIVCHITDVVQHPDYIFWYHNDMRVLDNLDPNLEIMVTETGPETIVSALIINSVQNEQSGNYTCMPSNLHASSLVLHVLIEEHQAAMQDGRNASSIVIPHYNIIFTAILLLCLKFSKKHLQVLEKFSKDWITPTERDSAARKTMESSRVSIPDGRPDSIKDGSMCFSNKTVFFHPAAYGNSPNNTHHLSTNPPILLFKSNHKNFSFEEQFKLEKITAILDEKLRLQLIPDYGSENIVISNHITT